MTRTITRMFDTRADAEAAVVELEEIGVDRDDISIIAHGGTAVAGESRSFDEAKRHDNDVAEDAGKGAATGGVIGAAAGLLAGLGVVAIPGIGPVVAAGWLGSTLIGAAGGAVVGGATGSLIGAMTEAGVEEKDAHVYAENVRRGGAVVSVRCENEDQAPAIEAALDRTSVPLAARRSAYEQEGWTGFDETRATPV